MPKPRQIFPTVSPCWIRNSPSVSSGEQVVSAYAVSPLAILRRHIVTKSPNDE
jgi:hypothetical protein